MMLQVIVVHLKDHSISQKIQVLMINLAINEKDHGLSHNKLATR